jgi:hypothetical protein
MTVLIVGTVISTIKPPSMEFSARIVLWPAMGRQKTAVAAAAFRLVFEAVNKFLRPLFFPDRT